MDVFSGVAGREQAIIELFTATFTASEGADEGARIGGLVRDLLADTPSADIRVFRAEDGDRVIGAAVFTRLTFAEDHRRVVLLSPLAVATARQRQGVGQALLAHALEALRSEGFDVAITYGDPDFYGKAGFMPISERQARAPLPLSFPHGWLGRSLTDGAMPDLKGASTCVPALNRTDVW
jgi:putative acetyltransferase